MIRRFHGEVRLDPDAVLAALANKETLDSVGTRPQSEPLSIFSCHRATKLFTVVDLSTVWVVADLHERDLSRVRVGSEAAITTSARPALTLRGRVGYIDPQVSADTRTAKVRIEVPNPGGELRLGMYADVVVARAPGTSTPRVPRNAVQNVGDRTVVYLANPKEPGKFVEREVRLGQTSGDQVEVLSGLQPGDVVVTEGSNVNFVNVNSLVPLITARGNSPRFTCVEGSHRSRNTQSDPRGRSSHLRDRGVRAS